ncbi:MAG: aminotransferase class I/II-fold pyridoxal phosphate-dependent enzyme [Rhodococcus sp. (in: high G+C Gram-positive bacteria)]|uniref:aminotransferase class I/II-fold pyridoxal phosphate-dependent enzyme n=1 Tax=Rhodococcus sp. TaxID=1831 RepID=UPI002ADC4471|nr:aminotransferase class I/II-fold pyridoxal phosphate-dependent enzyme [Rhodococcus sp. (in: high G+C Gram-positive bacteria)]
MHRSATAAPLSGASVVKFKHNDMADLEATLQRPVSDDGAVLVIVDGLYSMEGDLAPLDTIAELCVRYHAALMVDEAHSLGIYGEKLTGAAELFGISNDVDVAMASLSKSPSSTGGFVTGSRDLIDSLRVNARAFLFTTSGVPAAVGAALASVRLIRSFQKAATAPDASSTTPRSCAAACSRRASTWQDVRQRPPKTPPPRSCRCTSATISSP